MSASIKRAHFDALAPRWDAIKPPGNSAQIVALGLDRVEPLRGKMVVDVGCGTGLLEEHLLHRIGDGRVIALDFAPAMIARARERHADPRVHWICSDVVEAAIEYGSADVVLCFNTFPHFPRPGAALAAFVRWLRPGGALLLWHDVGREQLAAIHDQAGPPIDADVLPPIGELSALCAAAGLSVRLAEEDERSYTLLAERAARSRSNGPRSL